MCIRDRDDSIRSERVQTRVAELDMRYRQDTIVLRKEMQIQRQAVPEPLKSKIAFAVSSITSRGRMEGPALKLCFFTVSYTHLDVYKRQVYLTFINTGIPRSI